MTKKQRRVYSFICAYCRRNGYPPTIAEICEGCGTGSPSYVRETLWKLEFMGLIEYHDGKHRAIKIIQK